MSGLAINGSTLSCKMSLGLELPDNVISEKEMKRWNKHSCARSIAFHDNARSGMLHQSDKVLPSLWVGLRVALNSVSLVRREDSDLS